MAIGTVFFSFLPPDIMNLTYPGKYTLLDGSLLDDGTDLYKVLSNNQSLNLLDGDDNSLPDARGQFLRGLNVGLEGSSSDPDNNRKVGSIQTDDVKKHSHTVFGRGALPGIGSGAGNIMGSDNGNTVQASQNTGNVGGSETRPKNMALYVYIQINE